MSRRRVLGVGLVFLGLSIIGYVLWQGLGTDVVAHRRQARTLDRLEHDFARPTVTAAAVPTPHIGDAFGVITIEKIGLKVPIVQGVDPDQLAAGVGHYPDSPMPGQKGNVAFAGHRTTHGSPFSLLPNLDVGDSVVIRTRAGTIHYRITGHFLVGPAKVAVVSNFTDKHVLTLTTCWPKYGHSKRYIVRAEQVTP